MRIFRKKCGVGMRFPIIAIAVVVIACMQYFISIDAYAAGDMTLSVENDTSASGGFASGYGSELSSGEAGSVVTNPGIEVYFRDKVTEMKAGLINTMDIGKMTDNVSTGYGFFHADLSDITLSYANFSTTFTKDMIIRKTDGSNFSLKEIKFFQEGGSMDLIVEGYLDNTKQGEKIYSIDVAADAYVKHPYMDKTTAFSNIDEVRITGKNYNGTSEYDYILDSGFLLFNSITIGDPVLNQDQVAPVGLAGVAPTTVANNNGKITGTTTLMEYKLSTEPTVWSPVTETEITGLAAGTYHVRYVAKEGFNAGTVANVVIAAYVAPNGGGGGGSTHTTTKSDDKITVIVNGKEEKIGIETKETIKGLTEVKLNVDTTLLSKKIEEILKNNTDSNPNLVELVVSTGDNATVGLKGDIVKKMETEKFNLSIKKDQVEYVIPASQITIDKVSSILEVNSNQLKDIDIEVRINELSDALLVKYIEIAHKQQNELIVTPIEFDIVAKTTGTDGVVRETILNGFSDYVQRVLEIPANIDPSKITTGVIFNPDGTYSHVPTEVFQKNDKYYAKLNSLSNSTYSVIWNPITVDSVEGHWSEEAVNDMASRLVVVETKNFKPDAAITRAEFADYIVRALGLYREGIKLTEDQKKFSNVDESHSSIISITIASEWGIINGYPEGMFKPNHTITREEAMTMYAKAMEIVKFPEIEKKRILNYKDESEVAAWAYEAVEKTLGAGVFNGRTTEKIAPKGTFTHAEAATAVRNLLIEAKLINK